MLMSQRSSQPEGSVVVNIKFHTGKRLTDMYYILMLNSNDICCMYHIHIMWLVGYDCHCYLTL